MCNYQIINVIIKRMAALGKASIRFIIQFYVLCGVFRRSIHRGEFRRLFHVFVGFSYDGGVF